MPDKNNISLYNFGFFKQNLDAQAINLDLPAFELPHGRQVARQKRGRTGRFVRW